VVITSRRQLTGLAASEGAEQVTLDVLTEADARDLLARRLGAGRLAREPEAVERLITLCARLPLALSITAARAAARPAIPLASLAEELDDAHGRLDALDTGDSVISVRAAFSCSYLSLRPAAARMFRLVGLHPGPDITVPAAASLAQVRPADARLHLGELARSHLLAEHSPGRFTFHDLLRAYAREQVEACDAADAQRTALASLFDYYLAAAAGAMDTLVPAEHDRRPSIPVPANLAAPVDTPAAALAWLDAERATLVAIATHAATRGWAGHATRLAAILHRYLDMSGHYTEARTVHTHAIRAAYGTDDRAAQADALISLGVTDWRQGRYQEAADNYRQALALYRELGHRLGQARAFGNLGVVTWRQGRYEQAADHHLQALALYRDLGQLAGVGNALDHLGVISWAQGYYGRAADRHKQALALYHEIGHKHGQANALDSLGRVLWRQGHHEQAADHHQRALGLYRDIGHREGEASALDSLGRVLWRQGHHEQAADHHQRALDLYRDIGSRAGEAEALDSLGRVLLGQGRYEQAADHHQRALALFRELRDRSGEAGALNGAGEALRAIGRAEEARARHQEALDVAGQTGDRYQEARAHNGIGHGYYSTENRSQARQHWERALSLYTDLGVPDANDVRGRLMLQGDRQ
jgi:tetratricopeptide (TPR) repeat protein